jgi:hypothetical protein
MSKPKHTPAPWYYDGRYISSPNRGKTGQEIAELRPGIQLAKVDHANGHLIAAAPDLYAACAGLIEDLTTGRSSGALHAAYAALGKARGDAPDA